MPEKTDRQPAQVPGCELKAPRENIKLIRQKIIASQPCPVIFYLPEKRRTAVLSTIFALFILPAAIILLAFILALNKGGSR